MNVTDLVQKEQGRVWGKKVRLDHHSLDKTLVRGDGDVHDVGMGLGEPQEQVIKFLHSKS